MRQSECPGSLAVPYSTPSLPTLRGCLSPQPPSPLSPPSLAVAPQMSIKCADLSALAAARPVHCEWVKRLEDEFFLQASYGSGSGSIFTSNVFCERVNRLPPDLHLITHPLAHTPSSFSSCAGRGIVSVQRACPSARSWTAPRMGSPRHSRG